MLGICLNCKIEQDLIYKDYCKRCYNHLRYIGDIEVVKRKYSPNLLTEQQISILNGGLLGDACLRNRYTNAVLSINRSFKDKEYLLWQYDIFKDFCNIEPNIYIVEQIAHKDHFIKNKWFQKLDYDDNSHIRIIDLGDGYFKKEIKQIHFETRASPLLNTFYEKWYPSGLKIVPTDLVLDPLLICIWFCDDGCVMTPEKKNRLVIQFSTCGFSKIENEYLASLLSKRYGEYFYVIKERKEEKILYSIRGSDAASRTLLNEIDQIIPPGMERKAIKWRNDDACFYDNQPPKYQSRIVLRNNNREKVVNFVKYQFDNNNPFTISELKRFVEINTGPAQNYIKILIDKSIIDSGTTRLGSNKKLYTVKTNDFSSAIFEK